MIDLARRSGQIATLSARIVREGDDFSFEFGLEEKLVHRPGENEDAPVTHVYAVARLKDGGTQFEVMTRKQIELVRAQSKAGNNGPVGYSLGGNGKKNRHTPPVQIPACIH